MPVYNFIAYRPEGMDTCRGCVMGTSGSDFQICHSKDPNKIVDMWFDLMKFEHTTKDQREFSAWRIYLGLWGEIEDWSYDVFPEYPRNLPKGFEAIYSATKAKFDEWVSGEMERKLQEEASRRKKEQEEEEAFEREQLKKLMEKYGSST